MILGKVVGNVVATRKSEKLIGAKLMIVEPIQGFEGQIKRIVAVDQIGAGLGEFVLVATGSAARVSNMADVPTDATIVGIIDDGSGLE